MKKIYYLFLLILPGLSFSQSQALFSDSILAEIRVRIGADSLAWLYANPLSNQYLQADMVYEDGLHSDTILNIGFRLRGNTSRFSRKKSFKISFNTFVSGRRYQGVKKLNLNGMHNDPTLVREKFFYRIWQKAGMPERRSVFVKLFINDHYMGLYTGLEEMDKDWLQRVMGNNAGNLYKCTYPADLVYLGPEQNSYKSVQSSASTGGRAYSLETNEAEDDYSDLVQLCARLQDPVSASFQQNIQAILDVDGFLKALAFEIACGHWDDYAFNKNNYFLYRNSGSGRFHFISYDGDNTFGIDWVGIDWSQRSIASWINPSQARPLLTKILSYPPYKQRFFQITDSLNHHVLHPDSCFGWLDWAKNHILQAAEADSFRTLDYGYSLQDFIDGFTLPVDNHAPIGIKPFLQNRFDAVTQELALLAIASTKKEIPLTAFPNPFHSILSISARDCKSVEIIDFSGKKVSCRVKIFEEGGIWKLDFSLLPKGLYRIFLEKNSGDRLSCTVNSL